MTELDVAVLRSNLIGNADLKYRVLRDHSLVDALQEETRTDLEAIVAAKSTSLIKLENETVVLKILCWFLRDVLQSKTALSADLAICGAVLSSIGRLVGHIGRFLQFYIEQLSAPDGLVGLPASAQKKGIQLSSELQTILPRICLNLLDIVCCLSESHHTRLEGNVWWRWISSVALFERLELTVIVQLLRLVPILLSDTENEHFELRISTLLSALLLRLGDECDRIFVDSSLPGHDSSIKSAQTAIMDALGDKSAPFLELNCLDLDLHDLQVLNLIVVSTAQIFAHLRFKYDIEGNIPNKCYISLLVLLKYDQFSLNVATLNLIYFYLNHAMDLNESSVFQNIVKLFPRINELVIEQMDHDVPQFLFSPCKILAELCSLYPPLCDNLRRTNLDTKLLDITMGLFKNNSALKALRSKNIWSNDGSLISGSSSSNNGDLADLLILLSVFTSSMEEYRSRIAVHGLARLVFEAVDSYQFLLSLLETTVVNEILPAKEKDYERVLKKLSSLVLLLGDPVFTNTLYLMRLLLRSVSLLRTFFVECNLLGNTDNQGTRPTRTSGILDPANSISSALTGSYEVRGPSGVEENRGAFVTGILQILRGLHKQTKLINSILPESMLAIQNQNKKVCLGVVANFVLDFSAFRHFIVNYSSFLLIIYDLYNEKSTYTKQIQYAVLQVLKNYTYNETDENKMDLLSCIPWRIFFDNLLLDNIKHKVITFEIIRNLTSGSKRLCLELTEKFQEYTGTKWDQFLVDCITKFDQEKWPHGLSKLIHDEDFVAIVIAINYIEDHRHSNVEEISKTINEREGLFKVWLALLQVDSSDYKNRNLNSIVQTKSNVFSTQLSICYIIINLTYVRTRKWKLQYAMYDTIRISDTRIDINESSERTTAQEEQLEDDGSKTLSKNCKNMDLSEEKARAQYLVDLGFLAALEGLERRLGFHKPHGAKRFDYFMGNDVYEKVKTAHAQIWRMTQAGLGDLVHETKAAAKAGEADVMQVDPEAQEALDQELDEIDEPWIR